MKHLIWDYGTPVARITDDNETAAILREIEHEFTKDGAIQYSHKVGVSVRYRLFMFTIAPFLVRGGDICPRYNEANLAHLFKVYYQ